MSRLVVIRVGDTLGEWQTCSTLGKWSSPECHNQTVRDLFVQGYTVHAIFVSTGDHPLMVAKITNVRERTEDEVDLPSANEIGEFKTIISFDYNSRIDFRIVMTTCYEAALEYVKYKIGSQILVPNEFSGDFWSLILNHTTGTQGYSYFGNTTSVNEAYWKNLNMSGC